MNFTLHAAAVDGTKGERRRVAIYAGQQPPYSFLVTAAGALSVRLLLDKVVCEVFVGGGLGVASLPVRNVDRSFMSTNSSLWISTASTGVGAPNTTRVTATVWEMGCGWT